MDCPRCSLFNPPSAVHCDCGYEFASRNEAAERARTLRVVRGQMVTGGVIAGVAAVITFGTLFFPLGGASYIAAGGLFAGSAMFVRAQRVHARLRAQERSSHTR